MATNVYRAKHDKTSALSLRDSFAASVAHQALALANEEAECMGYGLSYTVEQAARIAYLFADAMLSERAKSTNPVKAPSLGL